MAVSGANGGTRGVRRGNVGGEKKVGLNYFFYGSPLDTFFFPARGIYSDLIASLELKRNEAASAANRCFVFLIFLLGFFNYFLLRVFGERRARRDRGFRKSLGSDRS